MKGDFHRRALETLADALERQDPEEREAFLQKACKDDIELRQQVDSLLKAREKAGDFLGRSVFGEWIGPWEEEPGTMVGPYRLIEELGKGGFGVVFSAEQQDPVRRLVALKIIKLGMDTQEVIARFEAERQALALLDHPNIAHVYEAGATDRGRPYFSMEFVKGKPITQYCEHHRLSIRQRLELFLQACDAVQHAHQRGLIHRDLKPSNIVVTELDGKPIPKIIDFGIAKSTHMRLSAQTLVTRYDCLMGTPAYMSPEQVELSGRDVDTRSDIYSLGVLLYELLAGSPPLEEETLRKTALDEVRRMIRDQDPPRPSTRLWTAGQDSAELAARRSARLKEACQALRNDLDWIVVKAIEKDPNRRYATVQDFSADLHRHLKHEPVSASPPSLSYRAWKFVRRHRTGVLAGAAATLALVVGLVFAGLGFARAEKRRTEAETTVRMLRQLLGADEPYSNLGVGFSLAELLDRLSSQLEGKFSDEPALLGEMHDILGRSYNGLQRRDEARYHHQRALELRRLAYGERHPKVADSLIENAWQIAVDVRGPAASEELADQAVQILHSLGSEPELLERALGVRGAFRMYQGKLEAAEEDFLESNNAGGLAELAKRRGDFEQAESLYLRVVEEARIEGNKLWEAHQLGHYGRAIMQRKKYAEAERVFRQQLALWEWVFGKDDNNYRHTLGDLQSALEAQGQVAEEPSAAP